MIKLIDLLKESGAVITDYQLTPKQFDLLKSKGAIKTNKDDTIVLYLPASIVDDLDKNMANSKFKQDFVNIETGKEDMAKAILSVMKKSINLGTGVSINSKKYFPLKGHLTKNGNFTFPNPYRVASGTYKSKSLKEYKLKSIEYYEQLLKNTNASPSTYKLFQGVVNSVKNQIKQNKKVTEKQLNVLQSLETGIFNPSTKN
jgi:hypothetical protein